MYFVHLALPLVDHFSGTIPFQILVFYREGEQADRGRGINIQLDLVPRLLRGVSVPGLFEEAGNDLGFLTCVSCGPIHLFHRHDLC